MTVKPQISKGEFIAIMALLSGTVAFSIDGMLPAMGEIADELSPEAPHLVQMIITSFIFGMGVGTLFAGPLSDAIGRRAITMLGAAIYCVGCIVAWQSSSVEGVVFARFLQGLGAAGPRVAAMAMTRDLYAGRQMARVISLIMMVFVLVPAVAPLIGNWIMNWFGWRSIFMAFIVFSILSVGWLGLRQSETLAPENKRPMRMATILSGIKEVFSIRKVALSIMAQALTFCMIFFMITTAQQVFDQTFDREASFPVWFAIISLLSASGSFFNARIVPTLGMRRVIGAAFLVQAVIASAFVLILVTNALANTPLFYVYLVWILSVFISAGGFAIGNVTALAMEPLGHMAGLASSIISAVATVAAAGLAVVAGLFFDGTPIVPVATIGLCAIVGLAVMRQIKD